MPPRQRRGEQRGRGGIDRIELGHQARIGFGRPVE
jgi:hypothetical protein